MPMNIDQQYILVVEDETLISMQYEEALEDVGFKQDKPPFDYELDGWVVHFAASKDKAAELIKRFAYDTVFLDHNLLNKETSETLVPQILRASPDCEVFLAGSSPLVQRPAVMAELEKENLLAHSSQIKAHDKIDINGFKDYLNSKIRPSGRTHRAGHSPSPNN